MKITFYMSLLMLVIQCNTVYGQALDSISDADRQMSSTRAFIYFLPGSDDINPAYKENATELLRVKDFFSEILNNPILVIDSIHIESSASPDGSFIRNYRLAQRRGLAFKEFLTQTFSQINPDLIQTEGYVREWTELLPFVTNNDDIPAQDDVIRIIENPDAADEEKQEQLQQLKNGASYKYISHHILEQLRGGNYCKVWFRKDFKSDSLPESLKQDSLKRAAALHRYDIVYPPYPSLVKVPEVTTPKSKYLAIKTNLLFWAVAVSNIGIECPIGQKWSVDIPFVYTPFKLSRKFRLEVLGIQPEIRYWLRDQMEGHFLGIHGHTAWYNVSMNKKRRYQDKDGDSPLWGAGLTYGYAKSLSKHWGLEFLIGAGYTNLHYDAFYNRSDGDVYKTEKKNYWGITRAAVNLSYRIKIK